MKKSLGPESHESVCRQWGDCKIVTVAAESGARAAKPVITDLVIYLDIVTLIG
jgi:hypothetical protein